MTVTKLVRDLVHRDPHEATNAESHIEGVAPRREDGLQAKASCDQKGEYEKIGDENHWRILTQVGLVPHPIDKPRDLRGEYPNNSL